MLVLTAKFADSRCNCEAFLATESIVVGKVILERLLHYLILCLLNELIELVACKEQNDKQQYHRAYRARDSLKYP